MIRRRIASGLSLALLALLFVGCFSVRLRNAVDAYLKSDIDTAEPLTESLLQSDPTDLRVRKLASLIATTRGVEALGKHDSDHARSYFERAKELNPADDVAPKYLDLINRKGNEHPRP